jgi:hypothetical protein
VCITGLISKHIKARIPARFIQIIHNYLSNRAPSQLFMKILNLLDVLFRPESPKACIVQYLHKWHTIYRKWQQCGRLNVCWWYEFHCSIRHRTIGGKKLSNAIKTLEQWFEKLKININVNKCSTTLFSNGWPTFAMISRHLRYVIQILLGQTT